MLSLFHFTFRLVFPVFLFQSLMSGPCLLKLIVEDYIRIHDFPVIVYCCKETAEGICSKQNCQNIVPAVFFHRTDSGSVFIHLKIFAFLGCSYIFFFLSNFFIIEKDFRIDQCDLLFNQPDFLQAGFFPFFQCHLFLNNGSLFVFQSLYLVLCRNTSLFCGILF